MLAALLSGCGSNMAMSPPPSPTPTPHPGNTNVVVLFTGTANGRLSNFQMQIAKVTLTDSAGNAVTLFSRPPVDLVSGITEFMHLNGASQPLATMSVPQATYTSASVELGGCHFTRVTINAQGGFEIDTFAQGVCAQGTGKATVNLPSPIPIGGSAMALSFNLEVPQSYTLDAAGAYTISPVFTLTPVTISAQPSNDGNGKVTGINARISSVNSAGNSFMAQPADGISLSVNSDANTLYQGLAGFSSLASGALVDFDAAIQPDGSLLATRVEQQDLTAAVSQVNLPLAPASPAGTVIVQAQECFPDSSSAPVLCNGLFQTSGSSTFHVSGQVSNLANLPFTPTFSSSTFVLGQSVSVASPTSQSGPGGLFAADLSLQPQTLNATVVTVATAGGFSVYTVTLAAYDVIPTTQRQFQGPFPAIPSPTSVIVYVDGNTQHLESGAIAPGSLLRFRGVVFDDNGTLRMDCLKILDGVAE